MGVYNYECRKNLCGAVLILVFVEVRLGGLIEGLMECRKDVLILVFVEVRLGEVRRARMAMLRAVLILVFVEVRLGGTYCRS